MTGEDYDRERIVAILKASLNRCAFLRRRVEKGAIVSEDDLSKLRTLDGVLYDLCLGIQDPDKK